MAQRCQLCCHALGKPGKRAGSKGSLAAWVSWHWTYSPLASPVFAAALDRPEGRLCGQPMRSSEAGAHTQGLAASWFDTGEAARYGAVHIAQGARSTRRERQPPGRSARSSAAAWSALSPLPPCTPPSGGLGAGKDAGAAAPGCSGPRDALSAPASFGVSCTPEARSYLFSRVDSRCHFGGRRAYPRLSEQARTRAAGLSNLTRVSVIAQAAAHTGSASLLYLCKQCRWKELSTGIRGLDKALGVALHEHALGYVAVLRCIVPQL
jgi:hypothetical protein